MATPGYLRGIAINEIIGNMHNAHEAGPWAVDSIKTVNHFGTVRTSITFKVGTFERYDEDDRTSVTITVEEGSGQ